MKPRQYKTRKGAERRMAALQAAFPDRRFWIAPTQSFKLAVYTTRTAPTDDPNAIGVACA